MVSPNGNRRKPRNPRKDDTYAKVILDLLLVEVTPVTERALGCFDCHICIDSLSEYRQQGKRVVRLAGCDCHALYHEECIEALWLDTEDATVEWECTICGFQGYPEPHLFPLYEDHIGLAGVLMREYFKMPKGSSMRFQWEHFTAVSIELPKGKACSSIMRAMDNVLRDFEGERLSMRGATQLLEQAGLERESEILKSSIEDISRERAQQIRRLATCLVEKAMRKSRSESKKNRKAFARELWLSRRYAGACASKKRLGGVVLKTLSGAQTDCINKVERILHKNRPAMDVEALGDILLDAVEDVDDAPPDRSAVDIRAEALETYGKRLIAPSLTELSAEQREDIYLPMSQWTRWGLLRPHPSRQRKLEEAEAQRARKRPRRG